LHGLQIEHDRIPRRLSLSAAYAMNDNRPTGLASMQPL
jgi:hypothetical protein